MSTAANQMTTVDQLLEAAFNVPRDPRSPEYKAGARATLDFCVNAVRIPHPYASGTATDDAYHAGIQEGHVIWRKAEWQAQHEQARHLTNHLATGAVVNLRITVRLDR